MKKVYVIHGWGGSPKGEWFPWIKKELEKSGFQVFVPEMPNTDSPKIQEWIPFLEKTVKKVDEETYFIGHSIGCQTILRYLEKLPENIKIGGIVFVGGWFDLLDASFEEEGSKEIADPWIKSPINLNKVLKHTNNITAIFSDDDPYVSLDNLKIFKEKLKARTLILHNKGHFNEENNTTEVPEVLKEFLKLAKN